MSCRVRQLAEDPGRWARAVCVECARCCWLCQNCDQPPYLRRSNTLPVALAFVEQMSSHPRCRTAIPSEPHLGEVIRLCRAASTTGKLVADAQHAALAITEGCTWVTRDADFGRFEPHGLRWQHLVLG